jgi:hypothetical protein
MSLGDAVLSRGIIRRSLKRADRSLAGDTALELAPDFLRAALFQRIGTPTRDKCERAHNRQGSHLLMLGSERTNARSVEGTRGCSGARRRTAGVYSTLLAQVPLQQ